MAPKLRRNNNPHQQKSTESAREQGLSEERSVTRLSVLLVLLVFAIKVTVSIFTSSLSFMVELSDSIIDLVAVGITFFALKESSKEPDFEHMWGHEKVNSFAAFLQGILILGLYGGLLYTVIRGWVTNEQIEAQNTLWGVGALVVTIFLVFFISRKIIRVGKKTKNQLIIAQGANFRGDFYRNITVIISLTMTFFNIPLVDSIVAIIFSLKSLYEGSSVLYHSYSELIDTNPIKKEQIEDLQEKLMELPGIKEISDIKIRTVGNKLDLSMCVKVHTEQTAICVDNMSTRMRGIIDNQFPDFECNTIFCTESPENASPISELSLILETIRKLSTHFPEISNVHNISIDTYLDEFLIQLHVDMDGEMLLQDSHRIISEYEAKIIQRSQLLLERPLSMDIISHIEPNLERERVHSHGVLQEVSDTQKEAISQMIATIKEVKAIKNLRVLSEHDGLYLSCTLTFAPDLKIAQTHAIIEMVESVLYSNLPNLVNCTLHPEPPEPT